MATEVFHIDANGVRISARRAEFGEHAYAPRNISAVEPVEDKGRRWPGYAMLFIGFAALGAGFVLDETTAMLVGAVAILSGSLNLGRKRPRYGIRIVTRRGPVYVLASRDKRYVEVVANALRRAVSASRDSRSGAGEPARDEPAPEGDGDDAPGLAQDPPPSVPAAPQRAESRRGGRPPPRRRRRR